jgi:hypothetical protein
LAGRERVRGVGKQASKISTRRKNGGPRRATEKYFGRFALAVVSHKRLFRHRAKRINTFSVALRGPPRFLRVRILASTLAIARMPGSHHANAPSLNLPCAT